MSFLSIHQDGNVSRIPVDVKFHIRIYIRNPQILRVYPKIYPYS